MSAAHEWSHRLDHLIDILNASAVSRVGSTTDAVDLHLRSIPLERMQKLTAELEERAGQDPDDIDRVAMRLLLNEYGAAVAHLRAVARTAATRVDGAPRALKEIGRYVHRRLKLEERTRLRREREHLTSDDAAPPPAPPSESR